MYLSTATYDTDQEFCQCSSVFIEAIRVKTEYELLTDSPTEHPTLLPSSPVERECDNEVQVEWTARNDDSGYVLVEDPCDPGMSASRPYSSL